MDISKDTKVNIKFVDSLEYVSSSSVLDKPDSQETTSHWGGNQFHHNLMMIKKQKSLR